MFEGRVFVTARMFLIEESITDRLYTLYRFYGLYIFFYVGQGGLSGLQWYLQKIYP